MLETEQPLDDLPDRRIERLDIHPALGGSDANRFSADHPVKALPVPDIRGIDPGQVKSLHRASEIVR